MRSLRLESVLFACVACGGSFSSNETGSNAGSGAAGTTSSSTSAGQGGAGQGGASQGGATSAANSTASSAMSSSSSSMCGGGAATPPDPKTLMLWLRADDGVQISDNRVLGWNDKSGKNNNAFLPVCATKCFCAASNDCAPEYVSNAINCLPAVHFRKDKAYGLMIKDADFLQWHNPNTDAGWEAAVVMVARVNNQPTADADRGVGLLYFKGSILAKHGPGLFANWLPPDSQSGMQTVLDLTTDPPQVASTKTTYLDGKAHVFAMARQAGNLYLRVDGKAVAQGPGTSNVSTLGEPVRIGSLPDTGSFRLDGDIAEIIALKNNVSALGGIESYLKAKYLTP